MSASEVRTAANPVDHVAFVGGQCRQEFGLSTVDGCERAVQRSHVAQGCIGADGHVVQSVAEERHIARRPGVDGDRGLHRKAAKNWGWAGQDWLRDRGARCLTERHLPANGDDAGFDTPGLRQH